MALSETDRKNYNTLKEAFERGDTALLQVKRKSDGKEVAAVCAVGRDDGGYELTPFAIMVEGNPFDDFMPPNPENGGYVGEEG